VYCPAAPEPPVVSEIDVTSCTVTYQPPGYDGGAPVTGYILERRTPGPDSEWITVNDTPSTDLQYSTDNLTPATEYEFRVAAVNRKGLSDFSPMSQKIITELKVPEKPGLLEVMDVTGTSVRLQWTAPQSDGGTDITAYVVMVWTSEEWKDVTVPPDANTKSVINYTIRNQLQADTEYRFTVAAINKVGRGLPSDKTELMTTYAGTSGVAGA